MFYKKKYAIQEKICNTIKYAGLEQRSNEDFSQEEGRLSTGGFESKVN